MIEIGAEEAATLWDQFCEDREAAFRPHKHDNDRTAIKHALTMAIARERTRAKEIIERSFATLENGDAIPKLIMQAVLEERERCAQATLEHLERCQKDRAITASTRYDVAITMLGRLLKKIRGGE